MFILFHSRLIIFFIVLFPVVTYSVGSSDRITSGESISQNETIVSNGSVFELGFFSPGNSTNYYIGIWYKNIPIQTAVWVLPVPLEISLNTSSLLFRNGTLYLNRRTIISATNATEAVLLDSGNFVLRGERGVLWQSFDYPSDTWLPGGKIGFDKINNRSISIVSWRNPQDPTPGIYSLDIDQNGFREIFLTRNRTRRYFSSGEWGGVNSSFSPNVRVNGSLQNFSYVSDADENYFTYSLQDSLLLRVVINYLGILQSFVWIEQTQEWSLYLSAPNDACAVYGACGSFAVCNIESNPICSCLPGFVPRILGEWNVGDFLSGCVRRSSIQCPDLNRFERFTNVLPAYLQSSKIDNTTNCESACFANCNCSAYSLNSSRGGCLLWTEDILDLQNRSNGQDLFVKLAVSDIPNTDENHSQNRKILRMAIPISVSVVLVILGCLISYKWLQRRRLKYAATTEPNRRKEDLLLLNLSSINNQNSHANEKTEKEQKLIDLPMFTFISISTATDNFSTRNKLGEGGFGPVYKGRLLNGELVAIKRLSKMSGQGMEEFRNETILIAKLQHRNLVRLLGCCIEKEEKILIYEYMSNKSLDSVLFDPVKKELLNWSRRVRIIDGIVQGLLYLHEYSRLRVVHRDLKASNILLDGDLNPKISDFGMARIFGRNDMHANTHRIVGTYGYMSPEYAMEGRFSIKSDVFAFGILLLEILSGKRNTGFHDSDFLSLIGYAWNLWENERIQVLLDPILEIPSSSSTIAVRYIVVGLLCVQENPNDRPTMSDVLSMLNKEQSSVPSPKRPGFILERSLDRADAENGSINYLTTSALQAR